MSVDGRDESADDGDPEADGRIPPQVPGRGGRADRPRSGHPATGNPSAGHPSAGHPSAALPPSRPPSTGRPSAGHPSGLPPAGAVPAQRDRRDDSGILPPPPGLPPSDAELVGRMRSGDDTAYEELYRRHADAVRRYARTCCRDVHTADDLTAEVFARMLQAVRGGSGPEHAVRAYLLTSVRRVAAGWAGTAKREQLVDDFALFASRAARASGVPDAGTVEVGADVRAMHEAEQSLAMRAFRSLPERWQAVLWHTEVEDESPSEVATLFGLDANGTRVLASRAREGLRQAYLQAHVSVSLATDEECARYADRLGTYARRKLRTRAERGLRKHLAECARCRLAATQIEEVAGGIPAVVPVAVIGWFGAAGYAKAAGFVAGGAGTAGAAAAGGTSGGTATSGGAGGAVAEGVGAPVKAGVAAGVVAVAAAAVALALVGDDSAPGEPVAKPPVSAPAHRQPPPSPAPVPPTKRPAPRLPVTVPAPDPAPVAAPRTGPPPAPTRTAAPREPSPAPTPAPASTPPPPASTPAPVPTRTPAPAPTDPPAPVVHQWSELSYDIAGDGSGPEMRFGESDWVWQRQGLSIGGTSYARGVTVQGRSSVTVGLDRGCSAFEALAGIDDLTHKLGEVYFSVHADGVPLWKSALVAGGDPAVPVRVDLTGRETVRLVVEPHRPLDGVAAADWAESRFVCSR
ncbi:sigma-70 family RNA polymerase sigma factor [Streptomyces glaucescens]|uniref:sigma-70 family RNA polymerase sigma factor n=1 Tax=Streptomyces glaucescens TaxID=1907 RepID=UPI0005B8150F|nr:sigma-70 family RNA polymerase sigma factor [Streptomyces glaucescens]